MSGPGSAYEAPVDVLAAALGGQDAAVRALDALRAAGWSLSWRPPELPAVRDSRLARRVIDLDEAAHDEAPPTRRGR